MEQRQIAQMATVVENERASWEYLGCIGSSTSRNVQLGTGLEPTSRVLVVVECGSAVESTGFTRAITCTADTVFPTNSQEQKPVSALPMHFSAGIELIFSFPARVLQRHHCSIIISLQVATWHEIEKHLFD